MTCPNQSTSVTIPYPSGTATVVPVDGATCAPLDPTQVRVQDNSVSGATFNATTKPALVADSAGLHFSANGSAFGFSSTFFFTYLPNGKTWAMTYVVGGAVTPVGTTSTP